MHVRPGPLFFRKAVSLLEVFWPVFWFAVGILLIVKGGDLFVDAASWIAEVSGIPKFVVGATVVSMATTLPEILVSLLAAAQGKPDMAVGNAVGSVTANLGLILGICAVSIPFVIRRRQYLAKGVLMVLAVLILYLGSLGGRLSLVGSALLLAIFAVFVYENLRAARKDAQPSGRARPQGREIALNAACFLGGAAGIVCGAQLLVDNGSALARMLGVPESIIGVTLIAIGTSLPELVTTIASVVKRQGALSVGNIVGANIIDTTLILPLCSLISGQALPISAQGLRLDLPFCLAVSALAVVPMLVKGKLMRWQGVCLFAVYGAYMALLIL